MTDALSHRVFRTVTVDKLLALAGLGAEKPAVILSDLVDWFYSYFDFTKVWSRRVIAEAVSTRCSPRTPATPWVLSAVMAPPRYGIRS